MKKCSLIFLILFIIVSVAYASGFFYDVPVSHWAYSAISYMAKNGIVSGYPDGSFLPNNNISKAEFAKIIVNSLNLNDSNVTYYADVDTSHWAYKYINIIGKYMPNAGTIFKPNDSISREVVAYTIVKALNLESSNYDQSMVEKFLDRGLISKGLEKYISIVASNGIMVGNADGTFGPKDNLSRAQVSQMLFNIISNEEKKNKEITLSNNKISIQKGKTKTIQYSCEDNLSLKAVSSNSSIAVATIKTNKKIVEVMGINEGEATILLLPISSEKTLVSPVTLDVTIVQNDEIVVVEPTEVVPPVTSIPEKTVAKTISPSNTPILTPARTQTITTPKNTVAKTISPSNTPILTPARTQTITTPKNTVAKTISPSNTPILTPARTQTITTPKNTVVKTISPSNTPILTPVKTQTITTPKNAKPTATPLRTVINTKKPVKVPSFNSMEYDEKEHILIADEGYILSGITKATNAGTYTAKASLMNGYVWDDGTSDAKELTWKITKTTASLKPTNSKLSFEEGNTKEVLYEYNGDGIINVKSSNPNVANVIHDPINKKIVIEGIGEGNANIDVSSTSGNNFKEASASISVSILNTIAVQSIKIKCNLKLNSENNINSLLIAKKSKANFTLEIMPAKAGKKKITWASSNQAIAKIDSEGVLTAVAEGTATITAKCEELTETCTVIVVNKLNLIDVRNQSFKTYMSRLYTGVPGNKGNFQNFGLVNPENNNSERFILVAKYIGNSSKEQVRLRVLDTANSKIVKYTTGKNNYVSGNVTQVNLSDFYTHGQSFDVAKSPNKDKWLMLLTAESDGEEGSFLRVFDLGSGSIDEIKNSTKPWKEYPKIKGQPCVDSENDLLAMVSGTTCKVYRYSDLINEDKVTLLYKFSFERYTKEGGKYFCNGFAIKDGYLYEIRGCNGDDGIEVWDFSGTRAIYRDIELIEGKDNSEPQGIHIYNNKIFIGISEFRAPYTRRFMVLYCRILRVRTFGDTTLRRKKSPQCRVPKSLHFNFSKSFFAVMTKFSPKSKQNN